MKRALACVCALTAAFAVPACVRKPGAEPSAVPATTERAAPAIPFGSHKQTYVAGIRPSGRQRDLDQATADFYDYWKKTYLRPGCNEGELVVESKTKPTNLTVSEAHGYGMVIIALMAGHDPDAKQEFDAMLRYHRAHGSALTPGIMAWYQNRECKDAGGDNGASDGDLDIAYALLLADKQWGSCGSVSYSAHASWVESAISQRELEGQGRYVLLGDWVTRDDEKHYGGTRTSDFMGTHFRAFAASTSDPVWRGLLDNVYWVADSVQTRFAPSTGLLPDFIQGAATDAPHPANMGFLEGARDGSYAYNACRIPLRMGTDFLLSGDKRPQQIAQRLNEFARKASRGDPKQLRGGYFLDGRPMVDYETMAFTGPLGVGAMVDPSNQPWLDALWQHSVSREPEQYYEDTLRLLSLIVMSGNWWAPDKAPVRCKPD